MHKLSFKQRWVPCLIIFSGVLIYYSSLHVPFHFDDERYIIANGYLRNIQNLQGIWSFWPTRFFTFLTFAINYRLGGLNVFGYHVFNILVHISSAILVWWFIKLIYSISGIDKEATSIYYPDLVALFAALIFLSSPVQTESVTYIYQRSSCLVAFFCLFSICLYLKARISQLNGAPTYSWGLIYMFSFFLYLTSMFTKENAAMLPLVIMLIDFYFFAGRNRFKKTRVLLLLASLLIIPALLFFYKNAPTFGDIQTITKVPLSSLHYLLTQFRVMLTYLRLIFIPINQNLDYDYPLTRSMMNLPSIISILVITTIILIAFKLYRKHRLISFGIFWFFLTLLPESSVIPLHDVIFEHRLYLPMVGYSIFITAGAAYLLKRKNTFYFIMIFSLLIVCYSLATYNRNKVWNNDLVLWNDVVSKSPKKAATYVSRGLSFIKNKEYNKAISDFNYALNIDPFLVEAYNARGFAFVSINQNDKALIDFNKAIDIDQTYVDSYNNRAALFLFNKEYDKAIADFNRALLLDPVSIFAYTNLGKAYLESDRKQEAIGMYKRLLEIEPYFAQTYLYLAVAYGQLGNHKAAINLLEKAIEINPQLAEAYANLGSAYGALGDYGQVVMNCKLAIQINPCLALAHFHLSVAYYYMQQYDLAIKYCDEAIKLGYNVPLSYLDYLKLHRKNI